MKFPDITVNRHGMDGNVIYLGIAIYRSILRAKGSCEARKYREALAPITNYDEFIRRSSDFVNIVHIETKVHIESRE